jgi:hypothetical protein
MTGPSLACEALDDADIVQHEDGSFGVFFGPGSARPLPRPLQSEVTGNGYPAGNRDGWTKESGLSLSHSRRVSIGERDLNDG